MQGAAARILQHTAHRPWPLPKRRWLLRQTWRDVLFAHWPVPSAALRRHVPAAFELDEHSGAAWLGLVLFRIEGQRGRGLPPLPMLSVFPQANLRTFVRVRSTPGIFLLSLDASSLVSVVGARLVYGMPYHHARMRIFAKRDVLVEFESHRRSGEAELEVCYSPHGRPFNPVPGTLEHFLVERYALFSVRRSNTVLRGDIHHAPWVLQSAEATIRRNTVVSASGIELGAEQPLLHFTARQDTLIWPPARER